MEENFNEFVANHTTESGIFCLVLSILLIAYQIWKKESSRMADHNQFSWDAYVYGWTLGIGLFVIGIIFILK